MWCVCVCLYCVFFCAVLFRITLSFSGERPTTFAKSICCNTSFYKRRDAAGRGGGGVMGVGMSQKRKRDHCGRKEGLSLPSSPLKRRDRWQCRDMYGSAHNQRAYRHDRSACTTWLCTVRILHQKKGINVVVQIICRVAFKKEDDNK